MGRGQSTGFFRNSNLLTGKRGTGKMFMILLSIFSLLNLLKFNF